MPSVWVEPHGHWGEGDINLVELSTEYEGLDNIVAFWDPKVQAGADAAVPFRLYALLDARKRDLKLSDNKVVATRVGADPRDPQRRQFAIDFAGPKLRRFRKHAACGHRELQRQRGDRGQPGLPQPL